MTMHEAIVTKRDFIHVGSNHCDFDPAMVDQYEAMIRELVEAGQKRVVAPAETSDVAWVVIMCNPRCEERASDGLKDKGFAVYVPTYKQERIIKRTGHKKEVRRNLFARYMFVSAPYGSWPRITSTDGVQGLIHNQGTPLIVPDEAIISLLDRQNAGEFDTVLTKNGEVMTRQQVEEKVAGIRPGARMKVMAGTFASFACTVVEAIGFEQAKVLVTLFGKNSPITIDIADLQAA